MPIPEINSCGMTGAHPTFLGLEECGHPQELRGLLSGEGVAEKRTSEWAIYYPEGNKFEIGKTNT